MFAGHGFYMRAYSRSVLYRPLRSENRKRQYRAIWNVTALVREEDPLNARSLLEDLCDLVSNTLVDPWWLDVRATVSQQLVQIG